MSEAGKEGVWLRLLLQELGHVSAAPTVIWADNQGAISLAESLEFHKRTKHIDTKFHYFREVIEQSILLLELLPNGCGRSYKTTPTKAVSAFPGDDGYGLIMGELEWQSWNGGNRGKCRPSLRGSASVSCIVAFLGGPDAVGVSDGLGRCAAEHRRHTLHQNISLYGCPAVSFASLFLSL